MIQEWHDRKILAGDIWDDKIKEYLNKADIIVLLISQDYLASSACDGELKYALENKDRKIIIPIILKPCTWKDSKCYIIQALPKDGKPIELWDNKEEAWLNIYEGIKAVVKKKKNLFFIPYLL